MRRAVFAAAAALALLAGCDPSRIGVADRATVTVAGRDVTIAAPAGFCVDPASTNVSASGAFVMAGDCELLGGRPIAEGDADPIGAVLTASVSAAQRAGPGTLDELRRFAGTAQGRAALGRSGSSDRVRILATRSRGEVLYFLIEDRGPQPVQGIEPRFWRAFLEVQSQMTVLSALGFEGAGVGPTEGLALVQRFADAIQRANPT